MSIKFYLQILALILLLSCTETVETPETVDRKVAIEQETKDQVPIFYPSHEPKKVDAPFSDAVQVGNLFFLSGQIGMDQTERKLVPGGITAETTQTLENIKAVLNHHDLTMGDVVKAMVVLDNIEDFAAFNEVYKTYFPQKPARTTFAAEALAAGAKIEIEVIAVKSE